MDMNFPIILSRYQKINKNLVSTLVNRSFYFARPREFNDPLDCQINLRKTISRANDELRSRFSLVAPGYRVDEEFFDAWDKAFSEVGVICFSLERSSPLMWAHYADQHRGVRLDFTVSSKSPFAKEHRILSLFNVCYTDDEAPLKKWLVDNFSPSEPGISESAFWGLIGRYVAIKAGDWKYEKEVRLVKEKFGLQSWISPNFSLSGICFGLRTPPEDINLVKNLIQGFEQIPKLTHMVRSEQDMVLTEVPLEH